MTIRDFQRSRVYAAEQDAWGDFGQAGRSAVVRTRKVQFLPAGVLPSGRGSWSGMTLPNGEVKWTKVRRAFQWYTWGLRTVAECQAFVDMVAAARGVDSWRVTDGRSARKAAACSDGTIRLPRWSRNHRVILHEIAHHLTPDHHGPEFCAELIALIAEFISNDDALLLVEAFYRHKVRVAGRETTGA